MLGSLNLEGGSVAPPRDDEILAQIAKADIRHCCGLNPNKNKRLILKSWKGNKYVFEDGRFRFHLTDDLIRAVLDGMPLVMGDSWIQVRSKNPQDRINREQLQKNLIGMNRYEYQQRLEEAKAQGLFVRTTNAPSGLRGVFNGCQVFSSHEAKEAYIQQARSLGATVETVS